MRPTHCPNCGRSIQYDEGHQLHWDPDIIACTCKTGRGLTVVAIKYEDNWHSPDFFYKSDGKNGILPIENQRERRTFEALRYDALHETPGFTSQPYHNVRILWENGEAIGFYTDNNYFGNRGIGHIYARPEFRRKGHATAMIQDFLQKYPGEVTILGPNETMYSVLETIGLVEKQGQDWEFIGRMKWMPAV